MSKSGAELGIFNYYRSLVLLFLPPLGFFIYLLFYFRAPSKSLFYYWEIYVIALCGIVATCGGVLDWIFHRDPLKMRISEKERNAEGWALGFGGGTMFFLMVWASFVEYREKLLIPIIVTLIYTTVMICYDEFIFHRKRCGKQETRYHRMLVFGNGIAWMAWFHFIFVR